MYSPIHSFSPEIDRRMRNISTGDKYWNGLKRAVRIEYSLDGDKQEVKGLMDDDSCASLLDSKEIVRIEISSRVNKASINLYF